MLSVNALDFMNYKNALKGNYRKGVHAFRCILENPTQAADFAANLGGVCVVFGVPIGQDDRNSQQLLALLQASSVIDQAALTWLSQWYADYADDWDTMAGDTARASAIAGDALIWRAVGSSPVGAGKVIAAIAGLSCQDYADMAAVAASSTAMAAVTASPTAMAAIEASSMAIAKYAASAAGLDPADYDDMTGLAASSTAMAAVAASQTAMTAVAASSTAMAAVIASSTALNAVVSSSTAMAAVAASPVAVAAIWQSTVAIQVLQGNSTAWATFTGASSQVMGKAVAILAGLNPDDYADMTAVAASSTAMAAVIASSTALNAVVSSSTAMAAVAASATARTALVDSSAARTALKASPLAVEVSLVSSQSQYWNNPGTKTMRGLLLYTKAGNTDNAFTITKVDSTTLASSNSVRNAAVSGDIGYKDWLEAFPNSSWVLSSITFYAYYTTTKIKYIPC